MIILLLATTLAGSICNDGTWTDSEGRGTCSYHGGIRDFSSPPSTTSYRPLVSQPPQDLKLTWKLTTGVNADNRLWYNYFKDTGAIGLSIACHDTPDSNNDDWSLILLVDKAAFTYKTSIGTIKDKTYYPFPDPTLIIDYSQFYDIEYYSSGLTRMDIADLDILHHGSNSYKKNLHIQLATADYLVAGSELVNLSDMYSVLKDLEQKCMN